MNTSDQMDQYEREVSVRCLFTAKICPVVPDYGTVTSAISSHAVHYVTRTSLLPQVLNMDDSCLYCQHFTPYRPTSCAFFLVCKMT
jgi:hypothetical protein